MKYTLILAVSLLCSCTAAQRADLGVGTVGHKATVNCYSGGKPIYSGRSTGAVKSQAQSDGFIFEDSALHTSIEVSGQCVIIYDR